MPAEHEVAGSIPARRTTRDRLLSREAEAALRPGSARGPEVPGLLDLAALPGGRFDDGAVPRLTSAICEGGCCQWKSECWSATGE